ncbi:MAG TPA: YceI family protein [Solirubrobacteraceae bacterium]|nr:YceI family protein [Solirubrobacteraceae bacterium]
MSIDDTSPPNADLGQGTWQLDPERSAVEFTTRTFWGAIPVNGGFSRFRGRLDPDADPVVELVIDAASVNTRNAKRDAHLRTADFFDVDAHPEIRFRADTLEVHGDHAHVTGTLEVAGRSSELEPMVHLRPEGDEIQLDAVARVNLREMGMANGPGGMIAAKAWLNVRARLVRA